MQMLQSAAETHLNIIYNCARNHPLPNYYCKHTPWPKILSLWVNSCNAGLRITCKLLASSVLMFLDEEHLHFLDMSDSDISSLLTAVDVAASSPDSTAEAFGYRYSLLELLQALHHISCSTVNFQKIAKPSFLSSLTYIVQRGNLKEKILSLRMLWGLLEVPELKDILKLSHVLEKLQSGSVTSTNEDILFWSEGILAAIHDPILEKQRKVKLNT